MSQTSTPANGLTSPSGVHVALRVSAGLIGSYAFAWGVITLGIALCLVLGLPYEDAKILLYLLCFLVFVAAFCWAFTAQSLARVWLTLAGGGGVMTLVGWLLAQGLN